MTKPLKSDDALEIAANVRELMRTHNVTEAELARSLDVSVMTIKRVTSGETSDPRISTLNLLANFFSVSIDSLINKSDIPIDIKTQKKPFFVPIITWEQLETPSYSLESIDFETWSEWYPLINTATLNLNKNSFALKTRLSMQPRYPNGTLLIIDQNEKPADNDVILIKSRETQSVSLRELVIDSPKWILKPIIADSELLFYNNDSHDIVGVVVLTVFQTR